jgi:hypothetical protein
MLKRFLLYPFMLYFLFSSSVIAAVRLPFVFIKEPTSSVVIIRLVINAGSAFDMHYHGLADLTANVLMATTAMQGAQKKIALLGGRLLTQVTRDATSFTLTVPANQSVVDRSVLAWRNGLKAAHITDEALKLGKRTLRLADQGAQSTLKLQVHGAMYRALFDKNPYAHPVWGDEQSVARLTVKQVTLFHHRYYRRARTFMVVSGPESDQAVSRTRAFQWSRMLWLTSWPESLPEEAAFPAVSVTGRLVHHTTKPNQPVMLVWAMLPDQSKGATRAVYTALSEWLRDVSGPLSRLQNDSSKGVYALDSGFDPLTHGLGVLWWQVRTDQQHIRVVRDYINHYFKRLHGRCRLKEPPLQSWIASMNRYRAHQLDALDAMDRVNQSTRKGLDERAAWGRPKTSVKVLTLDLKKPLHPGCLLDPAAFTLLVFSPDGWDDA